MEPEGYATYHSYTQQGEHHVYMQPARCTCWTYDWAPERPVHSLAEVEFIDPLCRHHARN